MSSRRLSLVPADYGIAMSLYSVDCLCLVCMWGCEATSNVFSIVIFVPYGQDYTRNPQAVGEFWSACNDFVVDSINTLV
jgi:hypothetical protein